MIVRVIGVTVKAEFINEFKKATIENHNGSMNEPGVLRFDVVQSTSDPAQFLLYEVYVDEPATVSHKETAHYAKWKELVTPMMAGDRTSSAYTPVVPAAPEGWSSV